MPSAGAPFELEHDVEKDDEPEAALSACTLALDVLECPACNGRMKLVARVTEPSSIVRFLSALGEPTDVPARSPNPGPPYWKSTVVRRKALGDAA